MSCKANIEVEKISIHLSKQKHRNYTWTQRFKESWKELYPWVEPASSDGKHVVCRVCNKKLRCKKDDIQKHGKGQKHRLNLQKSSLDDLESITLFSNPVEHCKSTENYDVSPHRSSSMKLCDIDVQPAVQGAIEALSHKMTALTAQLSHLTDPICVEKCSRSLRLVIDILTRLKNF
ncbi:hypothetical protein FHG87_014398 [Trinorchestia longiramus]|nr:hypothetical protein FHG87_014398 [Trinorchestia longiramus]